MLANFAHSNTPNGCTAIAEQAAYTMVEVPAASIPFTLPIAFPIRYEYDDGQASACKGGFERERRGGRLRPGAVCSGFRQKQLLQLRNTRGRNALIELRCLGFLLRLERTYMKYGNRNLQQIFDL
jgi:hypothetical protein